MPYQPKLDYSLRPAKAITRRMVVEALGRLGPLVDPRSYRYVGMGSIYFRDFQLIHRQLGIDDMITVEGKANAEVRVRFNLPLACIRLMMGSTGEMLPQIPLGEKPHIVWLDYESRVDKAVLTDVDETVARCASGSVLLFTVNASRPKRKEREGWLKELGSDWPDPAELQSQPDYALYSYRVLRAQIDNALEARNAGVPEHQRIGFRQIFHLIHADGAQMLTIGGALVMTTHRQQWEDCKIESLAFTMSGEKPYVIKLPLLTRREVQHLLRALPDASNNLGATAESAGIMRSEARQFAAVYRFALGFVEAEDF